MTKNCIPTKMEFVRENVILLSEKETKKTRRSYKNGRIGHKFRRYVKDICSQQNVCLPKGIKKYEPHHIVPISLGGTNDFSNLALTEEKLHRPVHWYIQEKIKGMKEGDIRSIKIPILRSLIWDTARTFCGYEELVP